MCAQESVPSADYVAVVQVQRYKALCPKCRWESEDHKHRHDAESAVRLHLQLVHIDGSVAKVPHITPTHNDDV